MKREYKTNINCGSCIKAVTGFIEEVPGLVSWKVDTDSPEKTLTVELQGESDAQLIEAVEDAGFDIQTK